MPTDTPDRDERKAREIAEMHIAPNFHTECTCGRCFVGKHVINDIASALREARREEREPLAKLLSDFHRCITVDAKMSGPVYSVRQHALREWLERVDSIRSLEE